MNYQANNTTNSAFGFQSFLISSDQDAIGVAIEFNESLRDSKVELFKTQIDAFDGLVKDQTGEYVGLVKKGLFIGANVPM